MAQVFGQLRDGKATEGEKRVLKLLKDNLPKEFSVYVECPLPDHRIQRFPDFIVLTNYGVIVLEVKDWVTIVHADSYHARIRMRGGQTRDELNPVTQAREIAILLANKLRSMRQQHKDPEQKEIPWGYGVVLPNLPMSTLTQLWTSWGEDFVLNLDSLDPALATDSLKKTLPRHKVRPLTKRELDYIRATINPSVLIEAENRAPVILDDLQEQIVSEPVRAEEAPTAAPEGIQTSLFADSAEPAEADQPDFAETLSRNTSIRLVRGIAGSGKSLVLTQRARYLAASYPEWKIAVLTYNDALNKHFSATLKGFSNLKVMTFHTLCSGLMRKEQRWVSPAESTGWLKRHAQNHPTIQKYGVGFLEDEIKWIKETGVPDLETYLSVERKGRGQDGRLGRVERAEIYTVLREYQAYLDLENIPDWGDVPHLVLQGLNEGRLTPPDYDAILIDEAQDFAPVWIKVVNRCLKPNGGVIFLADDPAQSIYRFYSWREKGVPVVGRTRWLKVPYRNTVEIYQAAYQIIASDAELQKSLAEEGYIVSPDFTHESMRHGPRPLLHQFPTFDHEIVFVREHIQHLLQNGMDARQIAVLHRKTQGLKKLRLGLSSLDVEINTFHALKGLEYEAVFLCQLQETYAEEDTPQDISQESRLVYMAMTRARNQLFMGYTGRLPRRFNQLREVVDFVE